MEVLLFKDKSDLAKGVLAKHNSGQSQKLYPEVSLYLGTIPNLRYEDYNYKTSAGGFTRTPVNAWKVHYEASGLSAELKRKYGISDSVYIPFKDELAAAKNQEIDDAVQKWRVTAP